MSELRKISEKDLDAAVILKNMHRKKIKRVRYHGVLHTYHMPKLGESIELRFQYQSEANREYKWLLGEIINVNKCSDGSGDIFRIRFPKSYNTGEIVIDVRLDIRYFPILWHFSNTGNLY